MTRLPAIVSFFPLAAIAAVALACSSAPERGPVAPGAPAPPTSASSEPTGPNDEDDADNVPPPIGPVGAGGNHGIKVFDEAKRELGRLYGQANQHTDLYCGCPYATEGHAMRVDLDACGYVAARDRTRASRIEWEHAVPAAAFGHTFTEWREGDAKCVDGHGKRFKGRKCARLASAEFARIEADLHNLFPVVGEVNGLRSDFPMGASDPSARATNLPSFHFGGCQSAIEHGVFFPRKEVRGDLARAYKYMDRSYPSHHLIDDAHRAVFDQWDRDDPPDAWEKDRNRRIAARQGNSNPFIGD